MVDLTVGLHRSVPAEVHRSEKPLEHHLLHGVLGARGGTLENEQLHSPDALFSGEADGRGGGGIAVSPV